MKNSLRIHKWTHNEFNIFILGVLTRPQQCNIATQTVYHSYTAGKQLLFRAMPIEDGSTRTLSTRLLL